MTPAERNAWIVAHAAWVHRLARALLRDADLAADVAQTTLAAAIERPPAIREPLQLRGWLRQVAQRIAAAARQRRREQTQREARAARPEASHAEAEAKRQLALHEELTAAVQSLPEPYRTAVTLRFFAELPPRAIARQCGASSEVVRQRVHRGLELLRQRLDNAHGSRAAWAMPFAACLPPATVLPILAAIAMSKKALAAAAVVLVAAVGTWLALPPASPPLLPNTTDTAGTIAAATGAAMPQDAGTTPAAAPASADSAVRATAEFAVLVVDSRGAPVANAAVHCWADGQQPVQRATGADGVAHFAAEAAAGGIVVATAAQPPRLVRVPALQGQQRVVLADGLAVAGNVLVDGEPAADGLRLELATARRDDGDLPAAVRELLAAPVASATTKGGWFSFRGLPADWHGELELPRTHWLLPMPGLDPQDQRTLTLAHPDEHLVLLTTRLQSAEGQVVWADDGSPVPFADVAATASFADQTNAVWTSVTADAEGRFGIGLYPAATMVRERWRQPANRVAIGTAMLQVEAKGSGGAHKFEFDDAALRAPEGLVLRLPRAEVRHFLAVDEHDQPVAGALLLAAELSAPTGADGRGTFVGEPKWIGAVGHAIVAAVARTAARGQADDPLVFVLPHGGNLRLVFHRADGGPVGRCRIQIATTEPPFEGSALGTALHRALAQGLTGGAIDGDHGPYALMLAPVDGIVSLPSPRPGIQCTLQVDDLLGTRLVERQFATPATAADAVIDIELPAAPRVVRGRVVDATGMPLHDAVLSLRRQGQARFATTTISAADGSYAFAATVDDGALDVQAAHPQCATELRVLPAGTDVADFRLARARRVDVRTVDPAGQAVACVVQARSEDGSSLDVRRQFLDAGHFAFPTIPQRRVTFVTVLGGREFACTPAIDATAATIVVPAIAHLVLAPPPAGFPLPAIGSLRVRAQAVEPKGEPFDLGFPREGDEPVVVPPGRYHFQLVRAEWQPQERRTVSTDLAASAELTIEAGTTATVALQ